MDQFRGTHILSVSQFDQDKINKIFEVADIMQQYARREKRNNVLDGAILGNLFFEPSTRTRVSFGTAFNLLGGQVRETIGIEASSLTKGESLYDTGKVISSYVDVVAMRHPISHAVEELAKASCVPVINGGDGSNEHPSQALLDLYTIEKELKQYNKSIDGLHIALVGDLRFGRTVHSLSRLLSLYKNITFTLVSPKELAMPDYVLEYISLAGHKINICTQLDGNLKDAHIIYVTRIQEERFPSQDEANKYRGKYRLNQSSYTAFCNKNAVIMHPLPRDSRSDANELDNDLNQNQNLAIFRQAQNGLVIRMALFALTLGVTQSLKQHEAPVNWYSKR